MTDEIEDGDLKLLITAVKTINAVAHKYVEKHFEKDSKRLSFLFDIYINLLTNAVTQHTHHSELLKDHFESIKKSISESFERIYVLAYAKMKEDELKEMH
jgi:hypothetical protein